MQKRDRLCDHECLIPKEIDAFTHAAGQRHLAVTAAGFVLDSA
ncbi:MAG: hypothetical protein ACREU9_02380 [Gammaproteobacteria bacterium]